LSAPGYFVDRLLIIDGHAYAYRAFHAIRGLRSPSGAPTNAIYGFVKMLAKMRAAIGPTHLIVVWDGGLSAERMAALPWRQIAGLRDVLIHDYPNLDLERVWLVASRDVPELLRVIETFLLEHGGI